MPNKFFWFGFKKCKNPNLSCYVNNPAAKADRFIDKVGQVTDPKNIYIWAPSNDPVATFAGGYGNDYWNSIKASPVVCQQ